ncbi:MAG: hypothetical protein H6617_05600 [Bdellovibrionaceae bacterium]|nr:hypothetical protein [Pseudobdellovibrionaceae bacterium]
MAQLWALTAYPAVKQLFMLDSAAASMCEIQFAAAAGHLVINGDSTLLISPFHLLDETLVAMGIPEERLRGSTRVVETMLTLPRPTSPALAGTLDLLREQGGKAPYICLPIGHCELTQSGVHVRATADFDVASFTSWWKRPYRMVGQDPRLGLNPGDLESLSDLVFVRASSLGSLSWVHVFFNELSHVFIHRKIDEWINANQTLIRYGEKPDPAFAKFVRVRKGRMQLDNSWFRTVLEAIGELTGVQAAALAFEAVHGQKVDLFSGEFARNAAKMAWGHLTRRTLFERFTLQDTLAEGRKYYGIKKDNVLQRSAYILESLQATIDRAGALVRSGALSVPGNSMALTEDLLSLAERETETPTLSPLQWRDLFVVISPLRLRSIRNELLNEGGDILFNSSVGMWGRLVGSPNRNENATEKSYFLVDNEGIPYIVLARLTYPSDITAYVSLFHQWRDRRDQLELAGFSRKDAGIRAGREMETPLGIYRSQMRAFLDAYESHGLLAELKKLVRNRSLTGERLEEAVHAFCSPAARAVSRSLLFEKKLLESLPAPSGDLPVSRRFEVAETRTSLEAIQARMADIALIRWYALLSTTPNPPDFSVSPDPRTRSSELSGVFVWGMHGRWLEAQQLDGKLLDIFVERDAVLRGLLASKGKLTSPELILEALQPKLLGEPAE